MINLGGKSVSTSFMGDLPSLVTLVEAITKEPDKIQKVFDQLAEAEGRAAERLQQAEAAERAIATREREANEAEMAAQTAQMDAERTAALLETRKRQLEEHASTLDTRETELKLFAEALAVRENDLKGARTAFLAEKSKELAVIAEKAAAVDRREADVRAQYEALDQQRTSLAERESKLRALLAA